MLSRLINVQALMGLSKDVLDCFTFNCKAHINPSIIQSSDHLHCKYSSLLSRIWDWGQPAVLDCWSLLGLRLLLSSMSTSRGGPRIYVWVGRTMVNWRSQSFFCCTFFILTIAKEKNISHLNRYNWFLMKKKISVLGPNPSNRSNRQTPLAFSDLIPSHKVV